jgi:hypothetical protein
MNWALPVTQKVAGSSLVAPAIRSRSSPETWVTECTVLPGSLKSKSYHPEEIATRESLFASRKVATGTAITTQDRGEKMKATQLLHNLGQSIWLDNITRDLMTTGALEQYIQDLSVTGLTSNPTIFEHAIKNSKSYDAAILKKLKEGKSDEVLFFELALDDLTKAADLFRPIYNRTNGVDGWVSLEVSPLLATTPERRWPQP